MVFSGYLPETVWEKVEIFISANFKKILRLFGKGQIPFEEIN